MDEERTEDLNPRSNDIEEKVKRMLDPRIPDTPDSTSNPPTLPSKSKENNIEIQAVSTPLAASADAAAPSAPELPKAKKSAKEASAGKSKRVTIPISQHDEASAEETIPEPQGSDDNIPPTREITIAEDDASPEDVANKLDAAIAELGPEESDDTTESKAALKESESIPQPDAADAAEETPIADPAVLTDPATDKAVKEIVAAEGDELLEVEDAVRDTDEPVKSAKKPRRSLFQVLKAWWAKPGFRWSVIILVLLAVIVASVIPQSRYFMLNTSGIRVKSSLLVLDESTQQPLKNVEVSIGSSTGLTNAEGKVTLQKIKLGTNTLLIKKRAFAPISKTIVVGWGSNPLGDFRLTPTGSQYSFTITDFLSGKPLSKIEASSNEASALSDDKGNIKLTIDRPSEDQFIVNVKADGYRTEKLTIDPNDKTDHAVKLVPARKDVFVSKRSGKYDVYSIYIDGKDEKLILAASGTEQEGMALVPHPSDKVVAYVSTRGGQHNNDGFLLSNLILINTDDNTTTNVATSERIQVIEWSGSYLVYLQIAAGSSANSPQRYRLISYNYKDSTSKELASSNFFNDVVAADGTIYYAPSSAYQTGGIGLYRVNPDGSGAPQSLFNQEVWNIFRTAYDHLALSVQQQWYDYHLGDKAPTKLNSAPTTQTPRAYTSSPDTQKSAWVDNRDGKGTLLTYDIINKKDTTLRSQSGLGYPIHWLSNTVIVYRVKTDQETADYAISTEGGQPAKIRDVTNTGPHY